MMLVSFPCPAPACVRPVLPAQADILSKVRPTSAHVRSNRDRACQEPDTKQYVT